jgi:hypothetical protein
MVNPMRCPFPGMDPYIERPAIWADFHDALIAEIRGILQPMLRPKYVALMQDRLYVVESKRPIYPDVAVIESARAATSGNAASSAVVIEEPMEFETLEDEIREPYIEIIEPAAGNRLITAIEVLSPENKTKGLGRKKYLQKRHEIIKARARIVEIDLLRAGKSTLPLTAADFARMPPHHYLIGVKRAPKRQGVYPVALQKPLPSIKIPLAHNDADVVLDLQAAFALAWEKGPYPDLLHYDDAPPGKMSHEEIAWCEEQLQHGGFRSA